MREVRIVKIGGESDNVKWSPIQTVRKIGRIIIKVPLLKKLEQSLRNINAVTLPAGSLHINSEPSRVTSDGNHFITVISANLWHDWPRFRQLHRRVEEFAKLVERENADILLVQEASRTQHWDVARWLAERLGMAFVYTRANGDLKIGFEEGLAVLSRYPIRDQNLIPLSSKRDGFVHRMALAAEIETPWGSLMAVSAHLAVFGKPNRNQFAYLRQVIAELGTDFPVVLGGDFNADEISERIEVDNLTLIDTYRAVNDDTDAITHILRWPWGGVLSKRRLDYIFLNPGGKRIKIASVRHYFDELNPLSDHAFVIARFAPA